MTKDRPAIAFALACILLASLRYGPAGAQEPAHQQLAAGKPINIGDVLSGELNVLKVLEPRSGKKVAAYQITSEPRQLPSPSGLCDLETGPETFELLTIPGADDQLKGLVGKKISVKVDEIACAENARHLSEAVVKKWSLVKRR
ncbi:hypothetical protein [Bradyrhizobium sp. STM 3562]|uniref:hypothetical protein n=1 Tax=Bradyrhizobium sp. STM 3562 TaxID=578924 RepID=UPI00388D6492